MANPEVKIKISMETAAAVRNARQLAQVSSEATKQIAADTKVAAVVTRDFAKAQMTNAEATVNVARASALMARSQVEQAKGQRAATQATLIGQKAIEDMARATLAEAKASETQARAVVVAVNARRLNQKAIDDEARALAHKTEAQKQSIAAENRQYRDEGVAIRQEIADQKALQKQQEQTNRTRIAGENRQHRDEGAYLRQQNQAGEDRKRGRGELLDMATNAGVTATMAVTLPIVAGGAKSVQLAMDLEQSLNVLQTQAGATDAQLEQMRKTARDLGSDMTLPATSSNEAAAAMLALSQKSLSVNDSMKAARGTLQLAAAATIDAAQAAEYEGDALNAFKLAGDQATRVADLFAASVSASGVSVEDNALALQQSAAVAHMAGLSIEELETAINLMAKAGIRGSDAGTSLKTMLIQLTAGGKTATQQLEKMQVSVYDAQGRMRPFREIVEQVSHSLSRMTDHQQSQVLKNIFGTDAIRGAVIALGQGTDAYDKMHAAVTKVGTAADLAAAKNKGLKGALDGLESELETVAEKGATPFLHFLSGSVNAAEKAIETLDKLPAPIKDFGLGLAGFIALAGPAVAGFGSIAGSVLKAREALLLMRGGAAAAATAEGAVATSGVAAFAANAPLMIALAAVAVTIGVIAWKWAEVRQAQDEATDSVKRYADSQKQLASSGERGALEVNRQDIASVRSYWQTVLDDRKKRADAAVNTFGIGEDYKHRIASGFDDPIERLDGSSNPSFGKSNADIRKTIAQLGSDDQLEQKRQREMNADGAGAANRSLLGASGDAKVAQAMAKHIGEATGVQCGAAVTKALQEAGFKGTATELAKAAMADKSRQIQPNARGQFPPGTIIYYPDRQKPNSVSGSAQQHFTVSGAIGADGNQYQLESTTAGGKGRHYQGTRKSAGIAAEHGGRFIAFSPSGGPASAASGPNFSDADLGLGGSKADKAAKDKAQALVDRAGLGVATAEAALEHCKSEYARTKDPYYLILAKAALTKVHTARMSEANATRDKAKQEAKAQKTDGEAADAAFATSKFKIDTQFNADKQALDDQISGTPDERRARRSAAWMAKQHALLYHTDTAIGDRETALSKGDIGQYDALKSDYEKRRQREIELAKGDYRVKLREGVIADKGQEKIRKDALTAELGVAIDQANQKSKTALNDLELRHNELLAAGFELKKQELQANRQLLEDNLAAAKTDEQKNAAQKLLFENTQDQLLQQKEIDQLSSDPNTRKMAATNYTIGVQSAVNGLDMFGKGQEEAKRDRRISTLRSEMEATSDLALRKQMLTEILALEKQIAAESGDENVIKGQKISAERETTDLARRTQFKTADDGLAGLLHGTGRPDKAAVQETLKNYSDLTVFGTPEQAQEAIAKYLDVLTLMLEKHWISQGEANANLGATEKGVDAANVGDSQTTQQFHQTRQAISGHRVTVGHTEFWEEMNTEASHASASFVMSLLHGKGSKNALKALVGDIGGMLEQATAGALQGTLQNVITAAGMRFNGQLSAGGKKLISDASTAGMALSAAINLSGANGKKKQTNTLLGLGLGLAAGALLPGVSLLAGAAGGGFLGGLFAEGGRPPVGKASIVGERGPELFIPDGAGTIIPNHMIRMPQPPSMDFLNVAPRAGENAGSGGIMADVIKAASSVGGDNVSAQMIVYGGISREADEDRISRKFGEQLRRGRQNGKRG